MRLEYGPLTCESTMELPRAYAASPLCAAMAMKMCTLSTIFVCAPIAMPCSPCSTSSSAGHSTHDALLWQAAVRPMSCIMDACRVPSHPRQPLQLEGCLQLGFYDEPCHSPAREQAPHCWTAPSSDWQPTANCGMH